VEAPFATAAKGFTEVKIVGVGGGGGNAVNRMVEEGVPGVEFIAVNTDAQALASSNALRKILLGGRQGRGLGAGGKPEEGLKAAQLNQHEIAEALEGADMVFVTAGMGGGTGTGASPVVAEAARSIGALTVGVVTLPFGFEGNRRMRNALQGIEDLRANVDALVVIPNDRLLKMADAQMTVVDAFRLADDILRQGVQGISDLVTQTGLINLDFADVKAIMGNAGTALMASGEAQGENRGEDAARAAISSALLETSIEGATGVLINVTGGADLTLHEVTEAANVISDVVDPSANIIFGAVIHPRYQKEVRVTVIATGLRSGPSERGFRRLERGGAAPRDERSPREERGNRDVTRQIEQSLRREPAADYDDRPPRRELAPREDDHPRREPPHRDDDRGASREDPNGGWRRRPAGSPLGDNDDDIDLPSFLRRRR
jgi:cell division protein FtsZ